MAPDGPKTPHWRVRYRDPDTRKLVVKPLVDVDAKTAETRRAFALELWRANRRRAEEIRGGATPHTHADMTVVDAFKLWLDEHGMRLAPKTQRTYGDACKLFQAWCEPRSFHSVRHITKGNLAAFAASRFAAAKKVSKRGGGLGGKRDAGKRATSTANKELRALSSVLNTLRRRDVIRLSSGDVADGLRREPVETNRREFYRTRTLNALLDACRAHDAALFKVTRKQHDAGKSRVDEQRYKPVLPVVLFVLLTGMRRKEALTVLSLDVDLDAAEIYLRGNATKTKHYRTIDLTISPLLAAIVSRLGRGRVLERYTEDELVEARKRLIHDFDAPAFTYHGLRRTCGTYLTCAPSVFGAASAYMSAKQLGHSVTVAEKHYTGQVKVSPDARTTEAAMQLAGVEALIASCHL